MNVFDIYLAVLVRGQGSCVFVQELESDVMPFLKNPQDTEIWSEYYFLELVGRVVFPDCGRKLSTQKPLSSSPPA